MTEHSSIYAPAGRVGATAQWYGALGFELKESDQDGHTDSWRWALVSRRGHNLLIAGGPAALRETVNIFVGDVDAMYSEVSGMVDVITPPKNSLFGERFFVIRDLNGSPVRFVEHVPGFRPLAG